MKHLHTIAAQTVKNALPPEKFYTLKLEGNFGKHTGNGWHAWDGLCPFHDDKTAGSFVINKKSGAFKCFSCNACGGDILDFLMLLENLGFKETLKRLGGYV